MSEQVNNKGGNESKLLFTFYACKLIFIQNLTITTSFVTSEYTHYLFMQTNTDLTQNLSCAAAKN